MKTITKKRLKAYFIDALISTVAVAGAEYVLRKKVKNEAFHVVVTPTIIMWALEYTQLKLSGQTVGYKQQKIILESQVDNELLTSKQILKRMAYRDTVSTFTYLSNPKQFAKNEGAILPQDRYAKTVVKEVMEGCK